MSFKVPSGVLKASLIGDATNARLAMVLPGANYSCRQSLLYFGIQSLLATGYRVLTIDSLYADCETWQNLPTREEALRSIEQDSISLFTQIRSLFPSGIHTLLGRSLGTFAIACALERKLVEPIQVIWQCPSLENKWSLLGANKIRAMGIIGTADPRYEAAAPWMPENTFVGQEADHAMELSDPIRSIELLKQITFYTRAWLDGLDLSLSHPVQKLELTAEPCLIKNL